MSRGVCVCVCGVSKQEGGGKKGTQNKIYKSGLPQQVQYTTIYHSAISSEFYIQQGVQVLAQIDCANVSALRQELTPKTIQILIIVANSSDIESSSA